MKFVTNLIGTMVVYAGIAAATMIGFGAGQKLYEDKIEPIMEKKLHKER